MTDFFSGFPVTVVLWLAPGMPLALVLLRKRGIWPPHSLVIFAAGLGLAANALLLLLFRTAGIPLTAASLLGAYLALGAGAVSWLVWQRKRGRWRLELPSRDEALWAAALASIFVGVTFLRWWPLKDLLVPPGVDMAHHVAIIDLILANGGLPSGYLPYWDLGSFTYHFGFHANAAASSLLSGQAPHETALLMGPTLLGLAALVVYVLVATLTDSREAGLLAALATGFIGVFPAFYVNWGRLPQLTGLILALLALSVLLGFREKRPSIGLVIAAAILVAGVFLTHYRMLLFFLWGAVAIILVHIVQERRLRAGVEMLARLAPVAALAAFLTLPWILNLLLVSPLAGVLTTPRSPGPDAWSLVRLEEPFAIPGFFWLLSLSIVGAVGTALARGRDFLFFVSWAGLSWFFVSASLVPLPISGLLDRITWVSLTFVFQAAFVGTGAMLILTYLPHRAIVRHAVILGMAGALVAVGVAGTGFVDATQDAMVTPADQTAFAWIEANLPPDAIIATNVGINPFFGGPEPADAGIWITYFTGRTQLAPSLVDVFERPLSPDRHAQLALLPIHESRVGGFDSYLFLRSLGATHLYLGARNTGPMIASQVAASPWYTVVYEEGNVTIAEIRTLDPSEPLVLGGGRDYSSLVNGYSITREWEENGTVVETYTFQEFRAEYSLPLELQGTYRISVHLADFGPVDWETGENMSSVLFELDGDLVLEHEYGTDTMIWLPMEVSVEEPGIHTFTVRNKETGIPFRFSMGAILVEYLGDA